MRFKVYSILFFVVFLTASATAQTVDILIKNAKILDGTGNSWFYGDIAVGGGKIVHIGRLSSWNAKKVIDATGLVAAPGFIDVHTHLEEDEKRNPLATNFILDGVTTCITGNCGLSNTNIKNYFSF
jgi:N-acyl-D-amino-acid deacylase